MKDGAVLLGVITADGRVAYAAEPMLVTRDFVASAQEGRPPEKRFRFADACAQSGCVQWTGSRCGVIDDVLAEIPAAALQASVPACSIRLQCRWYGQSGAQACHACPAVITDCSRDTGSTGVSA
jgi:hypothetical protein